MTFQPEDDGPFWLSTAQQEQQRSDKIEEGKTTKTQVLKEDLIKQLTTKGINATGTITNI